MTKLNVEGTPEDTKEQNIWSQSDADKYTAWTTGHGSHTQGQEEKTGTHGWGESGVSQNKPVSTEQVQEGGVTTNAWTNHQGPPNTSSTAAEPNSVLAEQAKIWGTRPPRGSNQRGQANVSGQTGQNENPGDTRDGDFIPNQNFISDYQQLQQLQFLQVHNYNEMPFRNAPYKIMDCYLYNVREKNVSQWHLAVF